jgi:hypothetical protein
MKKDYKKLFLKEVEKLLKDSESDWVKFLRYWNSEEYRQAYLFLEENIRLQQLKITERYKEIDHEFYGLYIA